MIGAAEIRNVELIKREGLAALSEKLGPVGMARFIHLIGNGSGDFTIERREIADTTKKEEILEFLHS